MYVSHHWDFKISCNVAYVRHIHKYNATKIMTLMILAFVVHLLCAWYHVKYVICTLSNFEKMVLRLLFILKKQKLREAKYYSLPTEQTSSNIKVWICLSECKEKCLFCHDDIFLCVQQEVIKNDESNVYKVKSVCEHWVKQN